MRVLHETIVKEHSSTLSCRDFSLDAFDCPYHRHQEIEVLRIDESRGRVLAGDFVGRFEPGEIYLFGSRLPHAFINRKGTTQARSRCLQFDPERLTGAIKELPEMQLLTQFYRKIDRGLLIAKDASETISQTLDKLFATSGLLQLAELFRLLDFILEEESAQELASEGYSLQSPDRHLEQLEKVLTHIHQNSGENLSVGLLAKFAGMSETTFHRHFRQRIGRTPNAYIQDVRLANVAQRLLESETSISEIAFAEGFNNLSNFNQQFQRSFQCTPREYRGRHEGGE